MHRLSGGEAVKIAEFDAKLREFHSGGLLGGVDQCLIAEKNPVGGGANRVVGQCLQGNLAAYAGRVAKSDHYIWNTLAHRTATFSWLKCFAMRVRASV